MATLYIIMAMLSDTRAFDSTYNYKTYFPIGKKQASKLVTTSIRDYVIFFISSRVT